uniref:Uncharacterized protein n=1 Tax=Rhizophora mucronata TaxID=61149 RepID=A0A2P2QFE0_RHIMU
MHVSIDQVMMFLVDFN